jgi:hypothetical protein
MPYDPNGSSRNRRRRRRRTLSFDAVESVQIMVVGVLTTCSLAGRYKRGILMIHPS